MNRFAYQDKAIIKRLKFCADWACYEMEGADFEDFMDAEMRMVVAVFLLEWLGVGYDPITGKEFEL